MKRGDGKLIATVALVVLAVIVLTQWAFKANAIAPFFIAEWTAGEFLDFAGSIIGAVATVVAVRMTIRLEREERLDDQRLSVLPLIAITSLERHVPTLDLFSYDVNPPGKDGSSDSADAYREYSPGREYIVINKRGDVSYASRLSEEQARFAHSGGYVTEDSGNGLVYLVHNDSLYYPLELRSAGNGPAINVSVRMQKDGCGPRHEISESYLHLPTVQLIVGESRYVGILFEDHSTEASRGKYELVVEYYDTLGHHYRQCHELELASPDKGSDSTTSVRFDLKIEQKLLT